MIRHWLEAAMLRLPLAKCDCVDDSEMIDALRDLVSAQADLIRDFREALLEEKRVSRTAAQFALECVEPEFEEMARQMYSNMCDRVARAEEHAP